MEFPLKNLDLTNYMPPPLPPGVSGISQYPPDDPRCQLPPYRYDLYGVTNHFGTLSTGHCECILLRCEGLSMADDCSSSRYGVHRITRRLAVLRRQPCITSRCQGRSSTYPPLLSYCDGVLTKYCHCHRGSQRTSCFIRGPNLELMWTTTLDVTHVTYNLASSFSLIGSAAAVNLYLSVTHISLFTFAVRTVASSRETLLPCVIP